MKHSIRVIRRAAAAQSANHRGGHHRRGRPRPAGSGGLWQQPIGQRPRRIEGRESAYSQSKHKKVPPSPGHETRRQAAQDYAQLLRWARCMRHRDYTRMRNPKRGTPQPNGHGGTAPLGGGVYQPPGDLRRLLAAIPKQGENVRHRPGYRQTPSLIGRSFRPRI